MESHFPLQCFTLFTIRYTYFLSLQVFSMSSCNISKAYHHDHSRGLKSLLTITGAKTLLSSTFQNYQEKV